ncbi:OmpA family protein [Flavobacterium kingsejongi]|uniref:OmpA-like domain-containing protein n=1 Tax=Flavobacterium kingsejongi TaxID=1678728 RepID=A0A2S1LKJ8_9FLAO|nr:OmpA family protein [Flavobacterium kingsejongi]AWG24248.1 hypothetical protein FK004_02920 [Flavobacterium kingsejongi]
MAFNLNKNEADPTKSSLAKNPVFPSRFDLKKEEPTVPPVKQSGSKKMVILLLVLLLIGGISYYSLPKTEMVETHPAATPENTVTGETIAPVATDSTPAEKAIPETPVANPQLQNSIAAAFAPGSIVPNSMDSQMITAITTALQHNPNATLTVNGYASSEGALVSNKQIAQARANAFKKYLIAQGIPANRIIATGKGITDPIATNDTPEGRMKNRRVEITIN